MKSLLSILFAVTISNAPVIHADPEVFMSFDFENGEIEQGFDDWYYSDKGEDPCDVYNGESQSKLCGPNGQKLYPYYSTYNTDHMGWGRYGFVDSSTQFSVRNSSLKVQTSGGPLKGDDGSVIYSGHPARSKSDIDWHSILNEKTEEESSTSFPGEIPLYFKTRTNNTRFEQLQGKNRFNVWVLMPRNTLDITQYRKSKKQRPDQRISWYPFINTSTSSHYYHHSSNIPMGGWTKVQFDAHPTHNNSGSRNRYSAFSTGGYQYPGDDISYFNNMTTFAIRLKAMANLPMFSEYYIDEITTEYKPFENEETINNIGVGYNPETHQFDISFEDKYRCTSGCGSEYEVRYSFEPIDNANYESATLPKFVMNFERSKSNHEGKIYKPNSGYNLLWAAVELQDEDLTKLLPHTKIFFAVKDKSNRSITQQEIDFEKINVPNVGWVNKTDLVKTIDYEIIPVNYPLESETAFIEELIVGHFVEQKLEAFGGEKPYQFKAINLPRGLTLSNDGYLRGTPTIKQITSLSFSITDAKGTSVTEQFEVEVFQEQDFDVAKCGLIVDLKKSVSDSEILDSRFNSIKTDKYTGFTDSGTTIVIGSNKQYDFTTVMGDYFELAKGDRVRTIWRNQTENTLNIQPNISLTQSGRIIYSDQDFWFSSSKIELKPGEAGVSEWVVPETTSGTLINVNSNFSSNKGLVLDKIELVEERRPESDVCSREFYTPENKTTLLVDFGSSLATTMTPHLGLNRIIHDTYTGFHENGMGTVVGDNPEYNFQGITGDGYPLGPEDIIKITWKNLTSTSHTFYPNISFNDSDRIYSGSDGDWAQMEQVTINPNENSISSFLVGERESGIVSVININNNIRLNRGVVIDKIEVVSPNDKFGFSAQPQYSALYGESIDYALPINHPFEISNISIEGNLPSSIHITNDGTVKGEASTPGTYVSTITATSFMGNTARATLSLNIADPAEPNVQNCTIVSNFNDIQHESVNGTFYDRYTDYYEKGMTNVIGSNKMYNYQGITINPYKLNHFTQIRTIWYNSSDTTITFSPRISTIKEGRYESNDDDGTWYYMSVVTIPPSSYGISSILTEDLPEDNIDLININSNYTNHKTLQMVSLDVTGEGLNDTCDYQLW